jgi:hypothetical protein
MSGLLVSRCGFPMTPAEPTRSLASASAPMKSRENIFAIWEHMFYNTRLTIRTPPYIDNLT